MDYTVEQRQQIQLFQETLKTQYEKRMLFGQNLTETYFTSSSFETLLRDNHAWYDEVHTGYANSYANPDYANEHLPHEIASICSMVYYEVIMMMPALFQKDVQSLKRIQNHVELLNNDLTDKLYHKFCLMMKEEALVLLDSEFHQNYSQENFTTKLITTVDLQDIRYLFRYGIYISESEIANARLLQNESDSMIKQLAVQMVESYIKGFKVRSKKPTNRSCSRIVQIVGLERIGAEILCLLNEKGQSGCIAELMYKNIDPQVLFDHRHDDSLYLQEDYIHHKQVCYQSVCDKYKANLYHYLGNIIMVSFGQKKLDTTTKLHASCRNDKQNQIMKQYEMNTKITFETYVPKSEISFTGMAFPAFEIDEDNFEKIFHDIMDINLMDSSQHEAIHELLIQVLDQSDYVEIIGGNGNETNIQVKMPTLSNPETQSNFSSCGSDVNIPVGEVYTSPQLKGTHGLLHIRKARISKVAFEDIKMSFHDGYIKEASCQNFDDPKKNNELMQDVIFHHRDTLPMGEFALGTNTYAYMKAKEDGILYKLHTLIFEKLGPHIAIGDTCYAWAEDNRVYSMHSGKEIVAKDNAFSKQRHDDITKAYTGIHYDLTIPYDEIHILRAHHDDGCTTEIVRDGLFVLAGCEYLNEPLKGVS